MFQDCIIDLAEEKNQDSAYNPNVLEQLSKAHETSRTEIEYWLE